jgi:hypothetical protein
LFGFKKFSGSTKTGTEIFTKTGSQELNNKNQAILDLGNYRAGLVKEKDRAYLASETAEYGAVRLAGGNKENKGTRDYPIKTLAKFSTDTENALPLAQAGVDIFAAVPVIGMPFDIASFEISRRLNDEAGMALSIIGLDPQYAGVMAGVIKGLKDIGKGAKAGGELLGALTKNSDGLTETALKVTKTGTNSSTGSLGTITSFSDLMTPADAARYNSYWDSFGINSKTEWTQEIWTGFKQYNPSGTIDEYRIILREQSAWPIGYTPSKMTLNPGDRFYMALDSKNQVSDINPGAFGLKENIPDVNFVRNDLAVKYEWKSNIDIVALYEAIKPLDVNPGPIGPQIDLQLNRFLPGNSNLTQYKLLVPKSDRMKYIKYIEGSEKKIK